MKFALFWSRGPLFGHSTAFPIPERGGTDANKRLYQISLPLSQLVCFRTSKGRTVVRTVAGVRSGATRGGRATAGAGSSTALNLLQRGIIEAGDSLLFKEELFFKTNFRIHR